MRFEKTIPLLEKYSKSECVSVFIYLFIYMSFINK